jgi:hypothetical protein
MSMETSTAIAAPALVYNGLSIRDRDEMLSLTDMWKAAGSDPSKRPSEWLRQPSTQAFAECVAGTIEVGNTHIKTMKGSGAGAGRGGGTTFAHWQIGLAYAKYLSPQFHMWCNEVVRERMEGKAGRFDGAAIMRRIEGVYIALSERITEFEKAVPALVNKHVEAALTSDPRRAVAEYVSVRQLLDEASVPSKRRNSINRRLGTQLRDTALANEEPSAVRRCPHTGVWLFQRDFATRFMRTRGTAMVRDHMARVLGQGVLRLVPTTREPGEPEH